MSGRTSISQKRYSLLLILFLCMIIIFLCISLWWGESDISISAFLKSLGRTDMESLRTKRIMINIRLSRALFAGIVGAMLAFSGALMQSILSNNLASPYTLGISSSAGFGAALAIISNISILHGTFAIMGNAFIFSCLSVVCIYVILVRTGISKKNIILAGMAINFLFSAANTLLQYFASPDAAYQVMFWTTGTLARASYQHVLLLGIIFSVCCISVLPIANDIGLIMTDEQYASSVGIQVRFVRILSLVFASLLAACTVSVVGVIGFVGLVAPQLARLLGIEEPKKLLPLSALIGAALLIFSDFVSRKLIQPTVLPIGAITALIGIPFFIGMILFSRKDT